MTEPDYSRTDLAPPWRSFVAIDTETTGLDPKKGRVVEVAALRFDMGIEVARVHSLIACDIQIPHESTKIHGIDANKLVGAPEFHDVWPRIVDLYSDGQVHCTVAFNGGFDHDHLNAMVRRARAAGTFTSQERPEALAAKDWIDVCLWSRHDVIDPVTTWGRGNHKLGAVCSRNGVPLTNAHSAAADAEATAAIWLRYENAIRRVADGGTYTAVIEAQRALRMRFDEWLESCGLKPRSASRVIAGTSDQDHQARMADRKAGAA